MNKNNNQVLGEKGELIALNYINSKGFSLMAKNYKGSRGELDLVIKKENIISFVEVKSRVSKSFLSSSLISKKKITSIVSTAKKFILENNLKSSEYVFRFDIALVHMISPAATVNYITNAFFAPE